MDKKIQNTVKFWLFANLKKNNNNPIKQPGKLVKKNNLEYKSISKTRNKNEWFFWKGTTEHFFDYSTVFCLLFFMLVMYVYLEQRFAIHVNYKFYYVLFFCTMKHRGTFYCHPISQIIETLLYAFFLIAYMFNIWSRKWCIKSMAVAQLEISNKKNVDLLHTLQYFSKSM